MMKHYEKLLAKGSFSREQLIEIVGTATAANQVIYEYQKKGLIEKVKRDFYVVISMETKQPVLSRYQIGSNLFPDACITHHSAFEVFGYEVRCSMSVMLQRINDFTILSMTECCTAT